MRYSDLIQFEPINEVVKFDRLSSDDYRKSLVRNFVFSQAYEDFIIPEICHNLDYTASYETFGTQIVGNYGTGKSHLMSLISLIAEDETLLPLVNNEKARKVLGNIAGKYKTIRFTLASTDEFWDIVCDQIDAKLTEWGIDYSIAQDNRGMYPDRIKRMMAHFEEKFPDKGLMIVVDEMLEYLKGRASDDRLNRDLGALRSLGEACDHSKFRMVFGVQELIYNVPQFQFAAQMLEHANHRYRHIHITEQDVKFVVQQRLLQKNDSQKKAIREHLERFTGFFSDMHSNIEEYINLFPVNPSFFDNFQQIRVGKSQREVLKTLSYKFGAIKDNDIPTDQPGLICYDQYWDDLNVPRMMTEPDVRRVSEIMSTIHQKIDENFIGARAKRAVLAHRIANACAVKILQDSLERTNGVSAENLVDDLCYIDANCMNRNFLIDVINTTAKQIVTATVGQYFERNNTNQEYHLRVEGGVNYEQKIKDFVATMSDDNKDSHFFNFLVEYLPIDVEQYRREFKIFRHRIDWKSHKTMLDGYIFMGNPNERSTTQPQQNFYIYFMPIFNKTKIAHGNEPDSVYVHMEKVSAEMKELLELYAAAESLIKSVDSSQKPFYEQYKQRYVNQLKPIFNREFIEKAEIVYQGEVQSVGFVGSLTTSKEQIVSDIASNLLEDYFCKIMPDYPKFTLLRAPLSPSNRVIMLKGARQKIVNPAQSNRDGEAILAGLGLLQENQLSIDGSIYAQSIKQKLEDKGEGQVLNRDEIIHRFYKDWDSDWRSNDYNIEADLEFLVLATMVAVGEIEIELPGKNINAANLREILDMPADNFYDFSYIRKPKCMNIALVRKIFLAVVGRDLTSQMNNPYTYTQLVDSAQKMAESVAKLSPEIYNGVYLDNIAIIEQMECVAIKNRLDALRGFCDRLKNFNSQAKLSNLPSSWTSDSLQTVIDTIPEINKLRRLLQFVNDFNSRISYLNQAKQYITKADMIQRIDDDLAKITDIVACMNDERKVDAYKAELDAIIGDYADWYLAEYKRLHITGIQDGEKRRIQQSNANKVCEAIFRADHGKGFFSQAADYKDWTTQMSKLNMENSTVNRDAVLRTPYVGGFNPVSFANTELPKLSDLNEQLNEIFSKVDATLHDMLKDKTLLDNKEILDQSEQGLLNRFNTGREDLSPENAERLVEIVFKLHRGIRKINIGQSDLRTVLNRPMTPDDAIAAFRKYINNIAGSSCDKDNVRIIFN